jgi:hypothetical protein
MTPPSAAAAPALRPSGRRPSDRRSAATIAPRRPLTTAPRPRRVSGPVRWPRVDRPAGRSHAPHVPFALVLVEALRRLASHRLLDRLIRGRIWIALITFALIGIVTLQLGLLKLNAGIGRALEREVVLQRENATLSIENSELAAGDRVQSGAARLGMEAAPSRALRFLTPRPKLDAGRGASALSKAVGSSAASSSVGSSLVGSSSTGGETTGGETTGGERSSGEAVSSPSSTASASAEGTSAASSESRASSGSASSPAAEAKAPSTEAAVAGSQPSTERSGPSAAPASGSAGASTEASPGGGTQAGP